MPYSPLRGSVSNPNTCSQLSVRLASCGIPCPATVRRRLVLSLVCPCRRSLCQTPESLPGFDENDCLLSPLLDVPSSSSCTFVAGSQNLQTVVVRGPAGDGCVIDVRRQTVLTNCREGSNWGPHRHPPEQRLKRRSSVRPTPSTRASAGVPYRCPSAIQQRRRGRLVVWSSAAGERDSTKFAQHAGWPGTVRYSVQSHFSCISHGQKRTTRECGSPHRGESVPLGAHPFLEEKRMTHVSAEAGAFCAAAWSLLLLWSVPLSALTTESSGVAFKDGAGAAQHMWDNLAQGDAATVIGESYDDNSAEGAGVEARAERFQRRQQQSSTSSVLRRPSRRNALSKPYRSAAPKLLLVAALLFVTGLILWRTASVLRWCVTQPPAQRKYTGSAAARSLSERAPGTICTRLDGRSPSGVVVFGPTARTGEATDNAGRQVTNRSVNQTAALHESKIEIALILVLAVGVVLLIAGLIGLTIDQILSRPPTSGTITNNGTIAYNATFPNNGMATINGTSGQGTTR